jgi:hypothetical protein
VVECRKRIKKLRKVETEINDETAGFNSNERRSSGISEGRFTVDKEFYVTVKENGGQREQKVCSRRRRKVSE